MDPLGLVRIHTENGVEINAYAGPDAGGIEHLPLHAHVSQAGERDTRILMEDYYKKGELAGDAGDVYPGDPKLSKKAKKVVDRNLPDLMHKTDRVYRTGGCG